MPRDRGVQRFSERVGVDPGWRLLVIGLAEHERASRPSQLQLSAREFPLPRFR